AVTTVSPLAGGQGIRALILDHSGTNPGFVSPMPASTNVGAYQQLIEVFWFDGTILRPSTTIDTTNVTSISSGNVKAETLVAMGSGGGGVITGSSAFVANPLIPVVTFWLPKQQTLLVTNNVLAVAVATGSSNSRFYPFIDGAIMSAAAIALPAYTGASGYIGTGASGLTTLTPGPHTLTQGFYATSGEVITLIPVHCGVQAVIFT
ncbi:MAG: hypothetical protein M3Y58_09190, partial [Chloroflexota bacterium]|nr:hypothetical protein [Chloroflexota bacterium]